MKLNEIQDLIKFVAKSGVSEVELETKDVKIRISTNGKGQKGETQVVMQTSVPMMQQQVPQQISTPVSNQTETKKEIVAAADDSKLVTIKSPMIGTFYRASGPDKPIFANVGDEIKA